MKFKINNGDATDFFIVEGTLEECREQALKGAKKRGWHDYWSMEMDT